MLSPKMNTEKLMDRKFVKHESDVPNKNIENKSASQIAKGTGFFFYFIVIVLKEGIPLSGPNHLNYLSAR